MAVPSLTTASSEPAGAAEPLPPIEPRQVGADYLLGIPEHADDPAYLELAVAAQLEQQGLLPMGTTDRAAAGLYSSGWPSRQIHDYRIACDVNGDGVTDIVSHDWLPAPPRPTPSSITMISGADGRGLWRIPNQNYIALGDMTGLYPGRSGSPSLSFPENFGNFGASTDLDGDGICDFLAFGFTWQVPVFTGNVILFNFKIHAISGKDGSDIWWRTFESRIILVGTPAILHQFVEVQVLNFPTGFLDFTTAEGPRYVLKTTDIHFTYARELVTADRRWFYDYRVSENVSYWDATRAGPALWSQPLSFGEDASSTNFTWITGVTQLDQDPALEVVLDSLWMTNPQGDIQETDPVTGRPITRYGRGIGMLALNGHDGGLKWRVPVYEEDPARVNLQTEEPFETIVWSRAKIVGSINGDAVPEIISTWYAAEWNEAGATSSRMRTHVKAFSGADGSAVWATDKKVRGWGFVSDLNAGTGSVPLLAMGTAETLVNGETLGGGRFPDKYVRIFLFDGHNGDVLEDYEARFHQDSYLPYELALIQFSTNLAPQDFDGDGIRDLVTPPRYVQPRAATQTLLSSAQQDYQVLSGKDLSVLREFRAWGSNGYAMACPGADGTITTLSGHARRLDLSRFDVSSGERVFRAPVFNDGQIQSATRGADMRGMRGVCGVAPAGNGTQTFFGLNIDRYTPQLWLHVQPVVGAFSATDRVWSEPAIVPDPGIVSFFDLVPQPLRAPSAADHSIINGAPAAFGLLAGIGLGITRIKRKDPLGVLP